MKKHYPKIVSDGSQRYRDARDYAAVRKRLFAEMTQRFESQKKGMSIWSRFWLEIRILREVRRELKKEFPDGSLHVAVFPKERA